MMDDTDFLLDLGSSPGQPSSPIRQCNWLFGQVAKSGSQLNTITKITFSYTVTYVCMAYNPR